MADINVVGVQFRRAGKIYDFAARDYLLRVGEQVVVETDRGPTLAQVVLLKYVDDGSYEPGALKSIVRKASETDLKPSSKITEEFAQEFTTNKVKELKLDMRILKAEVQFGGNKVIIFFSAPGRVDFRELVKQLAGGLKSRVELKQVGSRDETKIIGGLGICGREYCCSSFLREFVPVSIKMAKNQNLALNPSKVSGGCGRLLCCLTYENDLYSELRKKLPALRSRVETRTGEVGDVVRTDLLNQVAIIEFDDGQQEQIGVSDLVVVEKRDKRGRSPKKEDKNQEWGEDIDLDQLMDK